MDVSEQMMLQVWLGGLKAKLVDGDVKGVITELDIALARIDEDSAPAPDTPPQ